MAGMIEAELNAGPAAAPPPPAQAAVTDEGEEAVSPEEQQAYEKAVEAGMRKLYTPNSAKVLKSMIKAVNDPMKAAATIARDTIVTVDKEQDLPETVIAHAAQELLSTVLELMHEADFVDEEELPEVFGGAAEQLQAMLEDYYDDADEAAQAPQQEMPTSPPAATPAPMAPPPQGASAAPEQQKVMG